MLRTFKQEGIEGGIFGDIDFNPHREWIEKVCNEAGLTPHIPLWLENQNQLLRDFIDSGFEAVLVAARADLFGENVLGRKIDRDFIKDLLELCETKGITPCGEAGEYHTLVVDGPLFKRRLKIINSEKVLSEEHWFLDISNADLRAKQ
jgi:uncharacterized protein (TIGR00290 family)